MKIVKITYEQFCWLKKNNYNNNCIKSLCAGILKIDTELIDDIDFNYKLTIDVYLKGEFDE